MYQGTRRGKKCRILTGYTVKLAQGVVNQQRLPDSSGSGTGAGSVRSTFGLRSFPVCGGWGLVGMGRPARPGRCLRRRLQVCQKRQSREDEGDGGVKHDTITSLNR